MGAAGPFHWIRPPAAETRPGAAARLDWTEPGGPAAEPTGPATGPPARTRAAIAYAVRGDLRFLSHHNEIRMLARALVRAGWPLRFSEGFNPIPRFSIVLPRSVALASEEQVALVELRAEVAPERLGAALQPQLPADAPLLGVAAPIPERLPVLERVIYGVAVRPADAAGLADRIAERLAATEWHVNRRAAPGKPARDVEIRSFVHDMIWDGAQLHLSLWRRPQGTARPLELVSGLGLPAEVYGHRISRMALIWKSAMPPVGEAGGIEGNASEFLPGNDHQHESEEYTQDYEEAGGSVRSGSRG